MSISLVASIQRRVYYGWVIVGVTFLGFVMSDAFLGLILSLFIKPMSDTFNWTRMQTVGPIAAGTLAAGLAAPFLGRAVDKYGARGPMMVGAIAGGAALVSIPLLRELWQFFLFYGVIGAIARESIGGIVASTAIANWFIRKRGRAFALATMGIPVGGALLTPILQYIISEYSWQAAWVSLGFLIWLLVFVPSGLLVRRRPEDMGLRPDGDAVVVEDNPRRQGLNSVNIEERSWRPKEALRTPAFWLMVIIFGPLYVGPFAILAHIFPYLVDRGMSEGIAAAATSVFAFSGIPSRVFWGSLAEKFHIRYCVILHMFTGAATFALLILAQGEAAIFLAAFLCGMVMGGGMLLKSVLWPAYFGRRYVGSISGVASIFLTIGPAMGPLIAAWLYDITGHYQESFIFFMGTLVLAGFLMVVTIPPRVRAAVS